MVTEIEVPQQQEQEQKQSPEADNIFNKYIKGPKSVYAYISDVNSLDMFRLLQNSEEGKEFEYAGFYWTKKDKIVFRKTKEEHDVWHNKGGGKPFVRSGPILTGGKQTKIYVLRKERGADDVVQLYEDFASGFKYFGGNFQSASQPLGDDALVITLIRPE